MEEQIYWIWMSLAFGPANINAHKLLQRYPNPRDLYETVQRVKEPLPPLTAKEYEQIRGVTIEKARSVMEDCVRKHIDVVNMTEQRFPQRLLHIYNPPILLYVLGRYLPFNERLVIAMVGSREITASGYEIGRKIAYELARRDVIVISGMALGGDSSAHIGALQANGQTAAVIGCGCDINYPAANRDLHVQIALNGCILSEFAPGVRPEPHNFIMRNRILAGMANGVVVTECRQRSGALSTANYALEEGRDVFAAPNSALDEQHGGTFGLLQDGAVPVRKAEDIIAYYDTVRGIPMTSRNTSSDESEHAPKDAKQYRKPETRRRPEKKSSLPPVSENESAAPKRVRKAEEPQKDTAKDTAKDTPKIPEEAKPAASPIVDALPPQTQITPEPSPEKDVPAAIDTPAAEPAELTASSLSDDFDIGDNARRLYGYLTAEPQKADDLIKASGMAPAVVLASLTELECAELCRSLPGQRYLLP